MDTPVKRTEPEHQWVSAGDEVHKDGVKAFAETWCESNPGWKFGDESRNEIHGEADALKTITYVKMVKVTAATAKKTGGLPSSEMPSNTMTEAKKETHTEATTEVKKDEQKPEEHGEPEKQDPKPNSDHEEKPKSENHEGEEHKDKEHHEH